MIVTVMQPAYLPWLGFFNRIALADIVVILDHVRIDHNTKTQFANRNRIRTAQGETWLTVPIRTSGPDSPMDLNRVRIAGAFWARTHLRTIQQSYARAAHVRLYAEQLTLLYGRSYERLDEVNSAFFSFLVEELGLGGKRVERSSDLALTSSKGDLMLEICTCLGADAYISGPFGRNYLNLKAFASGGVTVYFHEYDHPHYRQCWPGFVSHLSALDLLLNCGTEAAEIVARKQTLARS